MKNSEHKHKAIKDAFDTIVEVNNQPNKEIDLTADDKYLKGIKKGNLGFGNHTTLVLLRYPFNTFGRANLGDKEHNNERMGKYYEPTTTIDWIFYQID